MRTAAAKCSLTAGGMGWLLGFGAQARIAFSLSSRSMVRVARRRVSFGGTEMGVALGSVRACVGSPVLRARSRASSLACSFLCSSHRVRGSTVRGPSGVVTALHSADNLRVARCKSIPSNCKKPLAIRVFD